MACWIVAQTIGGREEFASERVKDNGFDVLLPKTRVRVPKHPPKIVPLFPGYFFASIEQRWRIIEKTMGVLSLIMAGDRPAKCPDCEIEKLISGMDRNGIFKLPKKPKLEKNHKYAAGQQVRIISGTFRGLNGLYEGQSARERELILLELFGRAVPIEFDQDQFVAWEKPNEQPIRARA
jgi:transcriptional antiterminator RfaH